MNNKIGVSVPSGSMALTKKESLSRDIQRELLFSAGIILDKVDRTKVTEKGEEGKQTSSFKIEALMNTETSFLLRGKEGSNFNNGYGPDWNAACYTNYSC